MARTKATTKPAKQAPKPRARLDLVKAEALYRAGLSLEAIAEKCGGVSKQAVGSAAKKLGWKRDLTQRVADAVDRKLTEVDASIDEAHAQEDGEIVSKAALTRADVVVGHRKDIRRARDLVAVLMGQLGEVAQFRDRLEDLIEEDTKDDNSARRRQALMQAVSLGAHASVVKDLSGALRNLITLDRQAYNLGTKDGGDGEEKPPPVDWKAIPPAERQAAYMKLIGA